MPVDIGKKDALTGSFKYTFKVVWGLFFIVELHEILQKIFFIRFFCLLDFYFILPSPNNKAEKNQYIMSLSTTKVKRFQTMSNEGKIKRVQSLLT